MIHDNKLFKNLPNRRTFLKAISAGAAGLMACAGNQPYKVYPQIKSEKIYTLERSKVVFRTGTDRRETIYQALKPL